MKSQFKIYVEKMFNSVLSKDENEKLKAGNFLKSSDRRANKPEPFILCHYKTDFSKYEEHIFVFCFENDEDDALYFKFSGNSDEAMAKEDNLYNHFYNFNTTFVF